MPKRHTRSRALAVFGHTSACPELLQTTHISQVISSSCKLTDCWSSGNELKVDPSRCKTQKVWLQLITEILCRLLPMQQGTWLSSFREATMLFSALDVTCFSFLMSNCLLDSCKSPQPVSCSKSLGEACNLKALTQLG